MAEPSISHCGFLRTLSGAAAIQLLPSLVHATPLPDSIGGVAAAHGILAGCAVNGPGLRTDADFRRLIAAQAATVVTENAMKWRDLRPSPTTSGITDRYSWMSTAHPRPDGGPARGLPFDENLQPVDAYYAMLRSFGRVPIARTVS